MKSNGRGVKHTDLAAQVRRQIVAGRYARGSRLPTRSELERRFGASSVTVQRALDALVREGFVEVKGRRLGTFVAANPPHLTRYGLVSPYVTSSPSWSRYWMAIANAAAAIEASSGQRIFIYNGVEVHADNENYQRLLHDIGEHALAGVIYAGELDLTGSPLMKQWDFPCVALAKDPLLGQLPVVMFDWMAFLENAVQRLAARGRKRVAIIAVPHLRQELERLQGASGVRIRPYWIQTVHHLAPEAAANATHLLLASSPKDRPDGLVVTDDNLMEHVARGAIAAGVRVPADLDIVCHCNFPNPISSALPITRLGFDVRHILQTCIEIIDVQREGGRPPRSVEAPPLFEEELKQAQTHVVAAGGRL